MSKRVRMKSSYFVRAIWDPEASVWVSETDVPGLVIEADTLAEFESLMLELAPKMLALNEDGGQASVALEFSAAARREVAIA
ncbi:MAG TPA: DUF1902 domain-containing protein [Caulobacteraceae bacterium]